MGPHYQRKSYRHPTADYSQENLYFVTLCTHDRAHLFGEIVHHQMEYTAAGCIAQQYWLAIPHHFPYVRLHSWVVMPNHLHGIIQITASVGAAGAAEAVRANDHSPLKQPPRPFRSPSRTLGSIVRGFKIGVTKWMRQNTDVYPVWHRNYHDHIIRDHQAYENISRYIENNPANWKNDEFYLE